MKILNDNSRDYSNNNKKFHHQDELFKICNDDKKN